MFGGLGIQGLGVTRIGGGRLEQAARLRAGALTPLGDLNTVMASPPTITDPASDGANSTIQAAQGVNAGVYRAANATDVALFGGPISGNRIQTLTRTTGRLQGHSACIAFYTYAQSVDFGIRCNGGPWIAMVTEAGERRRIAAADRTGPYTNLNYYRLDFATLGPLRLIEVYSDAGGSYGGINVPDGYTIWPAPLPSQPKIAVVWDSFAENSMNAGTLRLKLHVPDWLAAYYGVNNPHCNGIGSTGVIADAGASNYNTFGERIAASDMDLARVGDFDLIFAPGSVNDGFTSVNGLNSPAGDATVGAAYQAYIAALMVAQPNAIIVGCSQQFSTIAAIASRTAAYKAAFLAAAGSARRMIWLNNSLFESAPAGGVIGADNVHPNGSAGAQTIGESLAAQILTYLQGL